MLLDNVYCPPVKIPRSYHAKVCGKMTMSTLLVRIGETEVFWDVKVLPLINDGELF